MSKLKGFAKSFRRGCDMVRTRKKAGINFNNEGNIERRFDKSETRSSIGMRARKETSEMMNRLNSNLESLTRESKKLIDSRKLEVYREFFVGILPIIRVFYHVLERFGWKDKKTKELFVLFEAFISKNRKIYQKLTNDLDNQAKHRVIFISVLKTDIFIKFKLKNIDLGFKYGENDSKIISNKKFNKFKTLLISRNNKQ